MPMKQVPCNSDMKLTRAKFNEFTRELVERLRKPVEQALADAKLTSSNIDEIVLVGGSTSYTSCKRAS
ncbi:MAG: Hsp70 family protein [Candidatus Obscuribacter sp.]|nr:Hsp70 family protein [Candidatus Obscuribacter sp.]